MKKKGNVDCQMSNERDKDQDAMQLNHAYNLIKSGAKITTPDLNPIMGIGLEEDELDGLNLVDMKRMREGPNMYKVMDTLCGLKSGDMNVIQTNQNVAALSDIDCATSHNNVLATLALQASHP